MGFVLDVASPNFDEHESAELVQMLEPDPVFQIDRRFSERENHGVVSGRVKLEERRIFRENDRVLKSNKSSVN